MKQLMSMSINIEWIAQKRDKESLISIVVL